MKRLFDIIIALVALVALAPIFALIAIFIKLSGPGPVLFVQTRVGKHRKNFNILKFRTMVFRPHIDQVKEKVLVEGQDNRITPVGRWLRASSLDELPQLLNILKGDMSLVGPRPVLPEQLAAIPQDKMKRFDVAPGITGLAQVTGRRSLAWPEQLHYDCEYAENHSFRQDMQLLLRTPIVVLKREGIYADPAKNWRAYLPRTDTDQTGQDNEN